MLRRSATIQTTLGFIRKQFSKRHWYLIVSAALILVISFTAAMAYWKAHRALAAARYDIAAERKHHFAILRLDPPASIAFTPLPAPAAFLNATIFQEHLFLCGSAGLFEYDQSGRLLKQYRVGAELLPSPLLRMTTGLLPDSRDPELLIVTASQGVLAFDGHEFRQIRPKDPDDRAITAILPLHTGQLLIGTQKRGVLMYDGKSLRQFHPALADLQVTELAGTGTDLWVGTMDEGVIHWSAGRAEKFSEPEGLPDRQIFSIALQDNKAYVGTATGVAEFIAGQFKRVITPGLFARSLYISGARLLIAGMEAGITEVNLEAESRGHRPVVPASLSGVQQITASGDTLLAVTSANLYTRNGQQGWRAMLSPAETLLSDRNISALAVDPRGRVWVGYFDHGLDLLDRNLHEVSHIEDDHVFCVNRILISQNNIAVATANGLVLFDSSGKQLQVLGRAQGLIADHITDVASYRDGLVLATPAGLTFLDHGGARSLYAFQGLVNNHIYAVATDGQQVVAGTLGGVSVLQDEHVLSNFTISTPGLKHNWISAITRAGDDWMIGTYGGGVVRLTRAGKFEDFEVGTGDFEVYPNAMLTTSGHVLAGTLGQGLYSFNRNTNRWSLITDGLPSLTVTALAAADGTIYVGTDNGLVSIPEQNLP